MDMNEEKTFVNEKESNFNIGKSSHRTSQSTSPRKTPKIHKHSSPGSTPTTSKHSIGDPDALIETLVKLLKNISSPRIEEPITLKRMDKKDIEIFIEQYNHYVSNGGSESALSFIDKPILKVIRELELDNPNASAMEVMNFLKAECKPKSLENIQQILMDEVCIDPTMSNGRTKIQSLFISLTRVLEKLGLDENVCMNNKYYYPFKHQKTLLLSKLPYPFQEHFRTWEMFNPDSQNRTMFYQQLIKAIESYTGNWDVMETSKFQTINEFENDHQEVLKEMRFKRENGGVQTRSRTRTGL